MSLPDYIRDLWIRFEGQTNESQAEELYNAILSTPDGPVVEVGSATGGTTIVLIKAAQQVGKMVYSVDPYPVELEGIARDYSMGEMKTYKEKFEENILFGRYGNIIQYNEDLEFCVDKIPDGISVAFIDGLHELDNVKKEYSLLHPKMAKGGIMYFHDMGFDRGQLTDEGKLTEFPKWVLQGEIIDKGFETRLEEMRQMLKIVI